MKTNSARIAVCLTYTYLLRIPIITMAILVALPFAARWTGLSALLLGIFDLTGTWSFFWVSLTALLIASSVMMTWRIILIYGHQRFKLAKACRSDRLTFKALLCWLLLALPTIALIWLQSEQPSTSYKLIHVASALVVTLTLLWTAAFSQALLNPSRICENSPDLTFPSGIPGLSKPLKWAQESTLFVKPLSMFSSQLQRVPPALGRGYLDYSRAIVPGNVIVLPGHGMAAAMAALIVGIFLLVGFSHCATALAYVLLLILMLCLLFAGAAFFLDRYRVPFLTPILIWILIGAQSPKSDYYYKVIDAVNERAVTPGDALRGNDPSRTWAIVAAATGGGIQASAWSAKVLTGLELASRDESLPSFGKSLRLVSGVSGGSVGIMYYLDTFKKYDVATNEELADAVRRAKESSLNEVVWGLVYPDLVRLALPFAISLDRNRGQILEDTWRKNLKDAQGKLGLSEWRESVREGWRPASIFGATIAETGERLMLTTSPFASRSGGRSVFSRLFENQAIPEKDVSIPTAARLSATFTYVTPVARADLPGPQFHIADGGYYDNSGMSLLCDWLDEALSEDQKSCAENAWKRITDVLVIQIRSSPPSGEPTPIYQRGWFYQAIAPLALLLNVRNAAQNAHRDTEFLLLRDKWALSGVRIDEVIFTFRDRGDLNQAAAPLSWHLTQSQKDEIEREWEAYKDFQSTSAPNEKKKNPYSTFLDFLREMRQRTVIHRTKLQSASPPP